MRMNERRKYPWPHGWQPDELGYLHNHDLNDDGTLGRYRSACTGCDMRYDATVVS